MPRKINENTPLTERQRDIYEFIKNFINTNKYPPTIREIGKYRNITEKGAFDHVVAIARRGYIKIVHNISRGIVVLK